MTTSLPRISLSLLALACVSGAACAQYRPDEHHRQAMFAHSEPFRLDERYHHDHYYPARGYAITSLPNGSMNIGFHGNRFFFHAGVWYRPMGERFVVIDPPFGIQVPILPPGFVALWVGGAPFYYANGAYYQPVPGQGYTVVAPPVGVELAQPAPLPQVAPVSKAPASPIIYPRNGQSTVQTEADRQACYGWAHAQANGSSDADAFPRAVDACMDARGYTLR